MQENDTTSHEPLPDEWGQCALIGGLISLPRRLVSIERRLIKLGPAVEALARSQREQAARIEQLAQGNHGMARPPNTQSQEQRHAGKGGTTESFPPESARQEQSIVPLAEGLFQICDLIADALGNEDQVGSVVGDPQEVLRAIDTQLFELLSVCGIEPLDESPGSPFDPSTMRVLEPLPRDPQGGGLCIRVSLRTGFRLGRRILRPQVVDVQQTA